MTNIIKEKRHSKFWILYNVVVIAANIWFFTKLGIVIYNFFHR